MAPLFSVLDFSKFLKKYRDFECRRIASYVLNNNYMDYRYNVKADDISLLDNSYAKKLIGHPFHALKGAHTILDYANLLWAKYSKIEGYLNESTNLDDKDKGFERAAAILKKRDEILQMLKLIKIQVVPYFCNNPTLPLFIWDFGIDPILDPTKWPADLIESTKELTYKKSLEWDFLHSPCKTILVQPKELFYFITSTYDYQRAFPCAFVLSKSSFDTLANVTKLLGVHNDKYFVFRDVCDSLLLVLKKDEDFYILAGYYDLEKNFNSVRFSTDNEAPSIANIYISNRWQCIVNSNLIKSNILVYCQ